MERLVLAGIDENGEEREYDLSLLGGERTVLYFYPKDNTSGCTKEACDFRDNINRIVPFARVLAVSPDSIESHKRFRTKQELNFPLLSDVDKKAAILFGVWKEKSMYGRKYMGIERSTFILDRDGSIEKEWRKVKVPGHVDEVIAYLTK